MTNINPTVMLSDTVTVRAWESECGRAPLGLVASWIGDAEWRVRNCRDGDVPFVKVGIERVRTVGEATVAIAVARAVAAGRGYPFPTQDSLAA